MAGILFFIIPLALIGCWINSLLEYISAKKEKRYNPDAEDNFKKRKLIFILLSIVTGAVVAIVIGTIVLMLVAVAYM